MFDIVNCDDHTPGESGMQDWKIMSVTSEYEEVFSKSEDISYNCSILPQ